MESRNRNIWIVVIAAIVILCCCLVVFAGLAIGLAGNWFGDFWSGSGWWTGWPAGRVTESVEQRFDVGSSPILNVDSFAGDVTVRATTAESIQVTAVKQASNSSGLGRIQVRFEQTSEGARVVAERPGVSGGNMSVRLEILAPAGTTLDLSLGAGNVEVDGLTGGAMVDNGAGNVRIQAAAGQAQVDLGAGNIDYQGVASGDTRFRTGAGNINIDLPTGANVRIDLDTAIGNVSVSGFNVDGQVSGRSAQGVIGSGGDATITANTSAGNITLR